MTVKYKIFLIMPFDEEFQSIFKNLKEKYKNKYEISNAGDLDNQQNILKDIVNGIAGADVIIADLTGLNPNVFYELGLAHGLGKKVILITQSIDELPFDIQSYRALPYNNRFDKINDLWEKLDSLLESTFDGSKEFNNPIGDFLTRENSPKALESIDNQLNDKINICVQSEEIESNIKGGFLDFIAGIEEDTQDLNKELVQLTDDILTMSGEMNKSATQINGARLRGGSGNANFIREIARNTAEPINQFTDKMVAHNVKINKLWSSLENNYLNLIDNQFLESDEHREEFKQSLYSLVQMKDAVIESNEKAKDMLYSFNSMKNIERRLNHAITIFEDRINEYLSIMTQAVATVDRIILKANIKLGIVLENKVA